jgi:thioesterase domain-containing protein/acyl carrier protein
MADPKTVSSRAPSQADDLVIAGLFAKVFELPSVKIDDDFFQLGGDSLLGDTLMSEIERRFGVSLSMSVLLEAPTPASLASRLREGRASRLPVNTISIREQGQLPPIFCIPGNDGESFAPYELSAALGDRVFYAFRSMGLNEGEAFIKTMDDFVANSLGSLKKVYPKGDLILLGHCAGATIAYEMAQRLTRQGRAPVGLVLVDPEVLPDHAPYLHKSGLALTLLQKSWQKRAGDLDRAVSIAGGAVGRKQRQKLVTGHVRHAIGTYTPKPYPGATQLMCTPERRDLQLQPDRGYPSFVPNLDVVLLSNDHTKMLNSGIEETAAAMKAFISRVLAMRGAAR